MQQLKVQDSGTLIDSLTEFYSQYRKLLQEGGDEVEYITCRECLESVITELNKRRKDNRLVFWKKGEPDQEEGRKPEVMGE